MIEQVIKDLNNKYLGQVRRILIKNAHIFINIREATVKEDMEDGFDSVLSFPDTKIPIRIRQKDYIKYKDFTVRSKTRYGNETEIHKLNKGFGDFYFYAWSDECLLKKSNNRILSYMILDLNEFRKTIINKPDVSDKANGDGTCFNIYHRNSLEKNNIIRVSESFNF